MSDIIFDAIGKILAAAAVSAIIYLTPKAKAVLTEAKKWLESRIGTENAKKLYEQIDKFVEAADQLYKEDDPTGEIRNNYVKTQLANLGIAITAEINGYIEGSVFKHHKMN